MERRFETFNESVQIATSYLAQPAEIPGAPSLDGWYLRIRLWHFPAFEQQRVWTIFRRKRPSDSACHTLLRQVIWDRPADGKRLFDPLEGLDQGFHTYPTIDVRDRPVDTSAFESRLAPLREISFAFVESPIGLDGESFGIELKRRNVHVKWWCEGPASWRTLAEWAAGMRAWLASIAATENPRV